MAIFGLYEVQVFVNGTPANEYEDDEEETPSRPNKATKYVQAISGANFEFKVLVDPRYTFGDSNCITASLRIDGRYAAGRILGRDAFRHYKRELKTPTITIDGRHANESTGRTFYKFQFSDLETRGLLEAYSSELTFG